METLDRALFEEWLDGRPIASVSASLGYAPKSPFLYLWRRHDREFGRSKIPTVSAATGIPEEILKAQPPVEDREKWLAMCPMKEARNQQAA